MTLENFLNLPATKKKKIFDQLKFKEVTRRRWREAASFRFQIETQIIPIGLAPGILNHLNWLITNEAIGNFESKAYHFVAFRQKEGKFNKVKFVLSPFEYEITLRREINIHEIILNYADFFKAEIDLADVLAITKRISRMHVREVLARVKDFQLS